MPKLQLAQITLRPATQDDCRRLWEWRNEPETREASFDNHVIPYKEHERWYSRKLLAEDTRIFIIMSGDDREAGYVRFNLEPDQAEISIGVDRGERGNGYGAAAIRLGSDRLLDTGVAPKIMALVKRNNTASLSAFQKAGFVTEAVEDIGGAEVEKMIYKGARESTEEAGL